MPVQHCRLPLPPLLQYIVIDTLGRGSFGKVKLCLNTGDDMLYAVKVVNTRMVSPAPHPRPPAERRTQSSAVTLPAGCCRLLPMAEVAGWWVALHSDSAADAAHLPSLLVQLRAADKSRLRARLGSPLTAGCGAAPGPAAPDLRREVEVMRALDHPSLLRLYEVIEDKEGGKVGGWGGDSGAENQGGQRIQSWQVAEVLAAWWPPSLEAAPPVLPCLAGADGDGVC